MFPGILDQIHRCCCEEQRRRRRRRFRIRFFTDEEEAQLLEAADAFNRDTGRSCGDFFKTLKEPGNADRALVGRPTLLAKVRSMSQADLLFASTTICARHKPEPGRYEVRRYEASGFGFPRNPIGQFRTRDVAETVVRNFLEKHPYPSLEGAYVFDLQTQERL